MFCTKTISLENKEKIKSITFKDELNIIGKKFGGAKNDCGITIIAKYNFCSNNGVRGVGF